MNLREWLFENRLSVTYFAGLLKVDRSYVHKWMKGSKTPSYKIMEKIRRLSTNQVKSKADLKDTRFIDPDNLPKDFGTIK